MDDQRQFSVRADSAELPTNSIFIPLCVGLLLAWFFVLSAYPSLLTVYTFVGVCLLWAAYRLPFAGSCETLSSFFLYERKMPRREFVGTLVTTNIGFFSSVAFSTYLIASFGIGPAIICVAAWIFGLYAFSTQVERLMPFLKKGSTLHEYIAVSYGRNERQIRLLALVSSIITFLLYIASVGVELTYTAMVFSSVARVPALFLVGALCVSGIFYVAIAGYRGVVSTDRLRFWAVLAGVLAIYVFVFVYWTREAISWPDEFFSLQQLTIGSAPISLAALLLLLVLYQFCVMDMWERCIAIARSPIAEPPSGEPADVATRDARTAALMRRMLVWESVIPFVLLFIAWYLIGLISVAQGWTADASQIIPMFFVKLEALAQTDPALGRTIQTLVIICFLSAALSTIDGFLIAAVQTVAFDWLGFKTGGDSAHNQADDRWALLVSRALIIVCGAAAVTVAFTQFDLMSFWVGMYSLMLSFFPVIWLSLHPGRRFERPGPARVGLAIVVGSSVAACVAVWGTFLRPNPEIVAAASFAAVGLSAAILLIGRRRRLA
jgi:Na+/proline symporter